MKMLSNQRRVLLLALFAAVVVFAVPASTLAQGRGRGWGQEKKWHKFINRHDARDGRWDGRGPRVHRRNFRDDDFFPRRAYRGNHYRFDRDFDRDAFRSFYRRNSFELRSWHWDRRASWRNGQRHQARNFTRWRTWRDK